MRLFPLRLFPDNANFDFIKFSKLSYSISLLLTICSFIWVGVYKFNFGIDFAGGISIELRIDQTPDLASMREHLNDLEIGEVVIQNIGTDKDLSIRVGVGSETELTKNVELIKATLQKHFPYKIDYRKVDFVGPQIGSQLINSGIIATILAFAAIMLYVWVRFEWQFGLGVLVALIHDTILCLGFMSVKRYDFNLTTVTAVLTVIGYSVNDSVVIYDRIRENLRMYRSKTIEEIINISINETLSRTTLTVATTLLANLSLVIWGGEAIRSFSVLVFFGILAGTYSSIFVSAPILTMFNLKSFQKSATPQV